MIKLSKSDLQKGIYESNFQVLSYSVYLTSLTLSEGVDLYLIEPDNITFGFTIDVLISQQNLFWFKQLVFNLSSLKWTQVIWFAVSPLDSLKLIQQTKIQLTVPVTSNTDLNLDLYIHPHLRCGLSKDAEILSWRTNNPTKK